MAARALLLLLLPPFCATLHVLPGLGRATLHARCSDSCTFDVTSQLATEPKHFIHSVINETGKLGLVSLPRKEATLYLTKARRRGLSAAAQLTRSPQAAIESCVPGAVVETGASALSPLSSPPLTLRRAQASTPAAPPSQSCARC